MENKNQNLEKPKYDPKKDLQKEKESRKPLEPKLQGNPLNEKS